MMLPGSGLCIESPKSVPVHMLHKMPAGFVKKWDCGFIKQFAFLPNNPHGICGDFSGIAI